MNLSNADIKFKDELNLIKSIAVYGLKNKNKSFPCRTSEFWPTYGFRITVKCNSMSGRFLKKIRFSGEI